MPDTNATRVRAFVHFVIGVCQCDGGDVTIITNDEESQPIVVEADSFEKLMGDIANAVARFNIKERLGNRNLNYFPIPTVKIWLPDIEDGYGVNIIPFVREVRILKLEEIPTSESSTPPETAHEP